MKKLLLFSLAVLLASLAARADVTINATNFPDANFRAYLLSEYPSGTITTAQLNARDSLYLYNKGISDMTGVQYFTQLTYLMCYGNNLTSIDVSTNTKLIYLNLGDNKLTSINVSSNTALQQLYLQDNKLTTVSVTNHSSLRTLWVSDNPNLTGCYCWRNALTNFDVSRCTSLQSLKCYNNDNLSNINGLSTCTALTYIDCEDCAITDLSAVTSFDNLQTLLCRNNRLTTLTITNKGSLKTLRASGNPLLTKIECNDCALTSLDISSCTALTELWCHNNTGLGTITGLASCTALQKLWCYCCGLSDLSMLNSLNNLTNVVCSANDLTSLTITGKSNLRQLAVDDNTQLTELYCYENKLIDLNVTGCTGLARLDCNSNRNLTEIDGLTDCTALTYFSAEYCALTGSLDMTFCPDLMNLYCYHNNLTGVNVTGLSELTLINCMQNAGLTDIIGLSDCTKLTYLECSDCALTSLDLSNTSALRELWCVNNQFTTLSVVSKPNLTTIMASGNSLLEELECHDCLLIRLEINNCPVLNYIDCRDNQLGSLAINTCPELMYLLCNSNKLTNLDISKNDKILFLWCNDNKLTSLDLSHCSEDFRSLDCRYNQITGTIDVSRFSKLFQLACSNNQISQLTLGDHPELQDIWCYENQLTNLDVNDLPALMRLNCAYNQLTSLNVSSCTVLETINCAANQLTSLNVSDCPALSVMNVIFNKLTGNKMGQVVSGLPTRGEDTPGELYALVDERYVDDDGYTEGNVITVSQVNQANAKYWNVYWWDVDSSSYVLYPGSTGKPGDVNDDGNVTIADVTALIDYLLNSDASAINLANADVTGEGQVTIADVTALIDMLLNGTAGMMKNVQVVQSASPSMTDICNKELTLEKPRRIKN